MLSLRGQKLLTQTPSLVAAHFRCAADPFDAVKNPNGYINLGTAENFLLWDRIEPKLRAAVQFKESAAHYDSLYGRPGLRKAIAHYLGSTFAAKEIDPGSLIVTSGASCAIDILAFALCDAGESILCATPFYSGFDTDVEFRADAKIEPIPLHSSNGFEFTIAAAQTALDDARSRGVKVKALLFNNPVNPLGRVLPEAMVREVIRWTAREGLHCIVDEIYASSVYGDAQFVSALQLTTAADAHVHIVSGFAKDFGLSGFKCGYALSGDPELTRALQTLAYLCPVSNFTHDALEGLLTDSSWLKEFFIESASRLRKTYNQLANGLAACQIPLLKADAGIFVWIDLRARLSENSFEAEKALWQQIFEGKKVSISPGGNFHCAEPGWFRLCFAKPQATLQAALERLRG